MFTISLCMIVRDEEGTLRRCLDSVKEVVDEIIIVDTGSRDHTAEIAREFTEKVYEFQWIDDFLSGQELWFGEGYSGLLYVVRCG